MLSGDDRPNATTLRAETWRVVESFLRLTDREREYTDKMQAGVLEPTLLFSDDLAVAERLNRYPPYSGKSRTRASIVQGPAALRQIPWTTADLQHGDPVGREFL